MKSHVKFWLIYFTLIAVKVKCEIIEPVDPTDPNVNITSNDDGTYTVFMNENNHDFNGVRTPIFRTVDATSPSISFLTTSFQYTFDVDETDAKSYILYATQSFDYETQQRVYIFNIFGFSGGSPVITLNITNIDDEPPSLEPPQCTFDENTIFTPHNSSCFSIVSDPDGWLSQMTFEIIENTNRAHEIFAMDYDVIPEDRETSAKVYMYVKEELNYQAVTFYMFDIRAEDGAHHPTTPNELVRAIVNVNDLPDTPPEWTSFFTTEQFDEQEDQTFYVTAIDGDYGLNYEINYTLLWEQEEDELGNYISIDSNGTIRVRGIDRDRNDISRYNFEIMAFEVPDAPIWNNTLLITFFVMDIDNNPPLVRWIRDSSGTNVSFDGTPDKSTKLSFLENYAGNLNLTIFIQDIDTGENAQFEVELEQYPDDGIDYTQAFLIVPTAGYRTGQFQISVRNATYLDFEVPEWVHISFNVLTTGTLDREKKDRMLVEITLIDYNDELPIFNDTEYVVEIKESAKIGDLVTTIMATDRDAEDEFLTHSLIGSTYTNRVLRIDATSGDIFVNADNAFDYDTVNPIFVQVRATDKADHTTTVPLTINLLDVNNKAPTISPGEPINVDENQIPKTVLNASITASDMDTTANLTAEIDWEASYAMKNSRRLDMTNETISREVRFLDVVPERIDENDDTNRDINIYLLINDYPDKPAPDFELFDSLYLSLRVTDLNTDPEFMRNQNTSALILISINDINDNIPFFPEGSLPESERENRTVQEEAAIGTSVGSIVAIDLDVGDTVSYTCTPNDVKFDWISVNSNTGAFTVISNEIDADTYKTFYFNYTCTASDGDPTHTSEPLEVRFYILDVNNQVPDITLDSTVHVDEKSDPLTKVEEIITDDMDRDIPFHTVECTLDRNNDCFDKFLIQENVIQVRNGGNDIDRDVGDETYSCQMTCTDNPDRLQNDRRFHTLNIDFTIVLDDINDHTPEVITQEIVSNENVAVGEVVGIILATDIDKGDNAEIEFSVSKVLDSNNQEVDIFETDIDENYFVNLTHKQANLVASKALRGLYGTYIVTIEVADKGDPPNSDSYEITVIIDKFNFEPPRFIIPSESGTTWILLSSQTPYSQLILFNNMESLYLDDFYASDNTEEDICNKWDVTINFEQTAPEDDTIFLISNTNRCGGQLQVNNNFDSNSVLGKTYELTLIARVREGEPQPGESDYTTETKITIKFMNNEQKPYFPCSSELMEFEFIEEELEQNEPLICSARYLVDDPTFRIFYFLDPDSADETVANTILVDEKTGEISLNQVISYKQNQQLQFSVVSSNDSTPWSYDPQSYLNITCHVIEINNNVPQWIRTRFFGAVMTGYNRNTVVVTVEATDLDTIDQGHLTYSISGSITSTGSGLNNLPTEPFTISSTLGEIRLNFQVDSTMSGFFQFQVSVCDIKDQFGNGPHCNTTDVTIFIITSENTVDFRFYNGVDEVQRKEDDMLAIISEILEYNAYKQNIDEDHSTSEDMTIASLYFVNDTTAMPANTILRSVSNINVYSRLVSELRNRTGLILMSFPSNANNSDNLEEVLKAWLVGVSVVLGALCLILLVTFVLKTRQLNNRIKNLTTNTFGSQESGLNRLGISAPTTNKHAIEGSNPIFNSNSDDVKRDLSKYEDFDRNSIRSGDSDLIGIEDNPEFDYNDRGQHI